MKPIIVDLKDISDSTEVYDSKPNKFISYTIYIICAILIIALLWMYFFRMDIVVKADSVFRGDDDSTAVSCAVTGKITKMSVKDGQYVNEGDELYEVDIENLGSTIEDYKSKLDSVQQRLDILNVYQKSLDGDNSEFDAMSDNQYYSEFKDRKELLNTSIPFSTFPASVFKYENGDKPFCFFLCFLYLVSNSFDSFIIFML